MKDASFDQDLFGGIEKPSQKKLQKSTLLPRSYTQFNVSYEQVIFISIAIIMLMVLLFSVGVEYGKRIARSGETGPPARENVEGGRWKVEGEASTLDPRPSTSPDTGTAPAQTETKPAQPAAEAEVKKAISQPKVLSQKFTIQAVAYRSKKKAQDDMVILSKKGFSPFIVVGGDYYQVCAGEYASKEEAMKDYEKIRKLYKDCFIRKR